MAKKNVNRIIKRLLVAEFIYQFMLGLFLPIFAIFIVTDIQGGTLTAVGLSYSVFWLARIATAIPFSRFMDETKGERDEYWFLLIGTFIMSTVVIFFVFVTKIWQVYVIEIIIGISGSMVGPSWKVLFTDHIDKGETGYEWSLDDLVIGLGVAGSAYLGAWLAQTYGFDMLFLIIGALGYIRFVFIVPLHNSVNRWQSVHRKRNYSVIFTKYNKVKNDIKVKGV
jgi:MFS family permease